MMNLKIEVKELGKNKINGCPKCMFLISFLKSVLRVKGHKYKFPQHP